MHANEKDFEYRTPEFHYLKFHGAYIFIKLESEKVADQ